MDAEMECETLSNLTNIQSFFCGQSVFLTGVTGLVGKVVLEKLLRSCLGISMVYIHMRPKKGLTPQQRLDKLFKLELFKELKAVLPSFAKKVQIIEGDISEHRLGIAYDDYETIRRNVSIVIHSAASVNFNDPIKISVEQNLKATQNVLEMCHDLPHIKAVVHVSTAYVKRESDGSVLEKIPKTKVSPQELIDALEWMDENAQKAVSDFLTEKILTTYLVTKALAEVHIDQKRGDLPVAIVRPGYIGPSWKEPFPGWIDSIQGVSGMLLAGAKGVLRTLQSVKNFKLNMVPVDFVANSIITSAWHVGVTRPPTLFILNAVFDFDKLPIADEAILMEILRKRDVYPLMRMFRYPDFTVYYNSFAYILHAVIDQWIPAAIIDLLLFIFTGRTILSKIYRKIDFLYGIFFRLAKDPWICRVDNINFLKGRLSERDSEIFFIDLDNFDWPHYVDGCVKGGRKYLAREDPSNIPYAKKKAYIWWAVTTIMKWFLILYFLYYVCTHFFSKPVYEDVVNNAFAIHNTYS